jgi:hypothetical protein
MTLSFNSIPSLYARNPVKINKKLVNAIPAGLKCETENNYCHLG